MIRIPPAIRLSVGLVILMISILILAQALGLAPSADRQQLEARKQLAESLANQVTLAIMRSDDLLLKYFLDSTVEHNPEIISAGVRRNDGILILQTSEHQKQFEKADPKQSTPTFVRLPLMINGTKSANFELSFRPLVSERHPLFHIPTFIVLIVFLSVSSFIGFWLYIRRVLHHLDPSSVVPARVRNAMNILAEGVLILDRREQIVLANNVILGLMEKSETNLLGKKASGLGWSMVQTGKEFPWVEALNNNAKQVGVRVVYKLRNDALKIFSVNVVPILDAKNKSQGVIAVFADVTELEEKSRLLEEILQQLAATNAAMEVKNKELQFLATRDPLTNCFNRRALLERLNGRFEGGRVGDFEYACIMADIDHFKRVNDNHGHQVGDEVIKMAANCIQKVVRDIDMVSRFGGEEFCIVLPGATMVQALAIAERCREKIAAQITSGVKVTCSFGVTSVRLGAKTSAELMHQADEALYYSKENGRNRVTSWATMPKSDAES